MCGFVGFILKKNMDSVSVSLEILLEMLKTIQNRGPDGEGLWHTDNIFLGHRRLAIVGGESGTQPLYSVQGDQPRGVLVVNGEIYNHHALRKTYNHYAFQTHSDCEVLFPVYFDTGFQMLPLRGMYAGALLDLQKKTLFLLRDPFFY